MVSGQRAVGCLWIEMYNSIKMVIGQSVEVYSTDCCFMFLFLFDIIVS